MPISLLIYKQRDPVPNRKNTPASNFHHVKYIATRPRVLKNELSNHGLFGNAETGEVAAIESLYKMQRLILKNHNEIKTFTWGFIIVTQKTARQLDLKIQDDYLKLVSKTSIF
jgi:hypothetical protein